MSTENEATTGIEDSADAAALHPVWVVVVGAKSIVYGIPGDRPTQQEKAEREQWVKDTVAAHLCRPSVMLVISGGVPGPEKIASSLAATCGIASCEYRLDGYKTFSDGTKHPWLASMPDPQSDEAKQLPRYRYQVMVEEMADQQTRHSVQVELLVLRDPEDGSSDVDTVTGLGTRFRLSRVTVEEFPLG